MSTDFSSRHLGPEYIFYYCLIPPYLSPEKAEICDKTEFLSRKPDGSFVPRQENYIFFKMVMRGLTWDTLKKTPSLIPLFVILGLGVSGAIFYPLRCALKSPDVTWNKSKNPEPWNEYASKQYKFYQTPKMEGVKKSAPPEY